MIRSKHAIKSKRAFDTSWQLPKIPFSIWLKQIRITILKRDSGRCFYCDYPFTEEFPPTLEHLLPIAAGGSNHISNLVLACEPCNKKVGSISLIDKIKHREFRLKTKL